MGLKTDQTGLHMDKRAKSGLTTAKNGAFVYIWLFSQMSAIEKENFNYLSKLR